MPLLCTGSLIKDSSPSIPRLSPVEPGLFRAAAALPKLPESGTAAPKGSGMWESSSSTSQLVELQQIRLFPLMDQTAAAAALSTAGAFFGDVWFIQRLSHAGERQLCFWGGRRGRQKYPLKKSISGQKKSSAIFRDGVPVRILYRGKNKSPNTRLGHLQPGFGDTDPQSEANLHLPQFPAQNLHIPRLSSQRCSFFTQALSRTKIRLLGAILG